MQEYWLNSEDGRNPYSVLRFHRPDVAANPCPRSGAVEGAVKHVIGRRLDHGGMRWTKQRAEAVLQLRCIEINGEWDLFEGFVHDRLHAQGRLDRAPPRLQQSEANPLPLAA